jgi:hypothetical protein
MKDLSERLLFLVNAAELRLCAIGEIESTRPILSGGWSRKQVIGHLIDSASNNHQRFVRATLQTSLDFPGYDQDGNVRVQGIQEVDWLLLVGLWAAYNRYLAHVIAQLPASKLETICRIGSNEPVTLAFLATDYLTHLAHHLSQIGVARDVDFPQECSM